MTKTEIEVAKAKAVKAYRRTMGKPENPVQEALRDDAAKVNPPPERQKAEK
jgi:hypothetical protein